MVDGSPERDASTALRRRPETGGWMVKTALMLAFCPVFGRFSRYASLRNARWGLFSAASIPLGIGGRFLRLRPLRGVFVRWTGPGGGSRVAEVLEAGALLASFYE